MESEIISFAPDFFISVQQILILSLLFLIIYYLINIGNRHIEVSKRISIDLKVVIKLLIGAIVLYILKLIIDGFPIIADTIWAVIAGVIIAFVINPVVTYLEKKGVKRNFGVLIVYISIIVIFTVLLILVIPKTIEEIRKLLLSLPGVIDYSANAINDFTESLNENLNIKIPESLNIKNIADNIDNMIKDLTESFQGNFADKIKNLANGMTSMFSGIIRIVLVLIFGYHFVVSKDDIKAKTRNHLPAKYKDDILYLGNGINNALMDFVRGRFLMAVAVGVLTTIYLLILRVDFAIVIGVITCVADIIPYVGPFLGFLPAVLFAFIDSPMKAVWVAIIFVIVQWAENNILAPKLLGSETGLSPLVILISIIIGGGMSGVWGMLFAVPVVSVAYVVFDFVRLKISENKHKN